MRYLKGEYLMLAVAAVLLGGCSKNSSDTELVGNWVKLKDFGGKTRTEATGFVINDTAYVGTGYQPDDAVRLRDLWAYDPVKDNWTQRTDLPDDAPARNSAVGMAINGKGYIGTGYDGTKRLNDFWEFDPKANNWTKKANFGGTPRQGAVAFSVKNRGYIATGYDGGYLQDNWRYDPAADNWTAVSSVANSKRTDAVAFVIADKAYIVTGSNSTVSGVDELSVYDPDADSWSLKRRIANVTDDSYDDDYNIVCTNASVFVVNNKAYLCTGEKSGSLSGAVWEYDPISDLWDQKHDFEGYARSGAVGFTVKGKGYLCTGGSSSKGWDDTWTFDPLAEYNKND